MGKNIKILLGSSILIHSGINLFLPVYAVFIGDIGGTLFDAGLAMGIFAVLRGVLYLLFRHLEERVFSKKAMIAIGYTLYFVSYVLYIFASEPAHIFYIQALLALGEVTVTPSWSAVIATSLTRGKERQIYSNFFGYRSLFEGIAAVMGGFFAMRFGFDTVFIVMAVMALSASVISLFIEDEAGGAP